MNMNVQLASLGTEEYSCEYASNKFFALCGLGGVVSCGLTHTMIVPLDLVKCRIQVLFHWFPLLHHFMFNLASIGLNRLTKPSMEIL